jgi:hypothetical protein
MSGNFSSHRFFPELIRPMGLKMSELFLPLVLSKTYFRRLLVFENV